MVNKSMNKKLGIAVIGAGKFAREFYLPEILRMDSLLLKAIVNRKAESARRVCDEFHGEYYTTDIERVLKDSQIDLVLIATRHELHKAQAIAAARAGKHMILEKPMALTIEDSIDIAREVQRNGVKFVLGFNRRFSSHAEKMRCLVSQATKPVMLMQRWQEQPLPSDFWHYDPKVGRGRILGMAVHFMDFMCFFTRFKTRRSLLQWRTVERPAQNYRGHNEHRSSVSLRHDRHYRSRRLWCRQF